jgi:hypothetical protein
LADAANEIIGEAAERRIPAISNILLAAKAVGACWIKRGVER